MSDCKTEEYYVDFCGNLRPVPLEDEDVEDCAGSFELYWQQLEEDVIEGGDK